MTTTRRNVMIRIMLVILFTCLIAYAFPPFFSDAPIPDVTLISIKGLVDISIKGPMPAENKAIEFSSSKPSDHTCRSLDISIGSRAYRFPLVKCSLLGSTSPSPYIHATFTSGYTPTPKP